MSTLIVADIIKSTEETLGNAIGVINHRVAKNGTGNGLTVFTDDDNYEVWLMKSDNSGSYLRVEFLIVDQEFNFGGFTADMLSRTLKDANGKGYIDSTITIAISKNSLSVNTVNIPGVERAVKVLTEGYIRSLEVLYRPSSSTL